MESNHGTRFSLLIGALLLVAAALWYRYSMEPGSGGSGGSQTGSPPAELTVPGDAADLFQKEHAVLSDDPNPYHTPVLVIPDEEYNSVILTQPGFMVGYCTLHLQPYWVAYRLTSDKVDGPHPRLPNFYADPALHGPSATRSDYLRSGFDRGHLVPAADMAWSEQSMSASFYFTNIAPQSPQFNRQIWKRLEEQVRRWARDYDTVYVVTGPVLQKGLPTIGKNGVSVPEYFYKVILRSPYSQPEGIAFLMHSDAAGVISSYAITIDSLERFTGIDFFPLMPQPEQQRTEMRLCIPCWNW